MMPENLLDSMRKPSDLMYEYSFVAKLVLAIYMAVLTNNVVSEYSIYLSIPIGLMGFILVSLLSISFTGDIERKVKSEYNER